MDRERHAGERVCNVGRVDPCFRIVAVIVVTVHGQAVGAEEVIVAPVPVLILGADIVVCHSLEQGNGGGNVILASLLAVILILSLAACGSSGNNTQNTEINANTNEPSNTVQPENTTPSSPTESSADNETQYMKGILIRR